MSGWFGVFRSRVQSNFDVPAAVVSGMAQQKRACKLTSGWRLGVAQAFPLHGLKLQGKSITWGVLNSPRHYRWLVGV